MDLKAICESYHNWAKSGPFDMGITTAQAMRSIVPHSFDPLVTYRAVAQINAHSQSNGSLMRVTPLAIWCRNL